MKNPDSAVITIKQSVSALQAGEALGLNPDRNGRCACPIHNGTGHNLKLDSGERGYHCFVCHAGGDVIHLVQAVNHMTFPEALGWLNETFSLGLDLTGTPDKKALEEARRAREKAKAERQRKHEEDMLVFETYADVGRTMGELETEIAEHTPRPGTEHWDKEFVDSFRAMEKLKETDKQLMDMMAERRNSNERVGMVEKRGTAGRD